MTINYNASILSIVVDQTVRRSTLTTEVVSSRSSEPLLVFPLLSCQGRDFAVVFFSISFLFRGFIGSPATPHVRFLLCFVL